MAVYAFRTSTFARNIYRYGTERLTARDGFTGVPAEYYVHVQQYAANNYPVSDIDNALAQTWINEQEHAETMTYVPAPQV